MALINCPRCSGKVNEHGHLIESSSNERARFEGATWDWFNIEMLPMDVGPCRGCHEVKTHVLTKWLNFLVLLNILYPRPDWDKAKKKMRRWKFR